MDVLVNTDKLDRAKNIADLVSGKLSPRTEEELERKNHFTQLLADGKIDLDNKDLVKIVYVKLGGLVRTEAEQKVADELKVEAQKKGKKRMIE